MQDSAIAIVGAAGRFPGARSLDEFWRNLDDGRETLTRFSSEELRASGVNPALWSQPDWVPVAGVAPDVQLFDADFFGLAHGEARATCPQHRIFLEHCWEALETAGYDPGRYRGRVGVFAGSNASTYLLFNILSNSGLIDLLGHAPTMIATDKDYLATRASYALNLRGPSVAVNTACSTSLVAVHMACQSLLLGECDMALAGAATVHTPPGYLHQPGLPLSPDGRCRPFDANAEGSGVGSGAGVVLLKPLADAERDADPILAIIRGSAMNNDGASKVSYTAPSVTGEEEVISEALGVAGVDPRTISYVETHGTGTPLGDPVELEALARVFRRSGAERQACGIGSVKSNLGHLGAAAGIAGLLKVVLALQHRRLPASLNFTTPNPRLGLHESPFRVVATTEDWNGPSPRRAGVSSFGVGGTNCHVVVEEPRPIVVDPLPPRSELLLWSARTPAALGRMTERLAGDLANRPDLRLRDVAFTLGAGRAVFRCRRALVASGLADAAERLAATDLPGVLEGRGEIGARPVAFLFPGGGAQQAGMAASLFQTEPVFRDALLRCRDAALPLLGVDLQTILATTVRAGEDPDDVFERESVAAAAIFTVSWSLAALWRHVGIEPDTMAGYSTGEYVAAALAGVMTPEEALELLVTRVDLINRLVTSGGAMLSVPLPAAACDAYLTGGLSLAGDNGPTLCVLSGPRALIADAATDLARRGVTAQLLRVRNGYHSSMLDPVSEPLAAYLRQRTLRPPSRRWVSTVTGATMRVEDATDPMYWVRHSRDTVRFGAALGVILEDPDRILLEVGPGVQLASMARQHDKLTSRHLVLSSLSHPRDATPAREALLATMGRLWLSGQPLDAEACAGSVARRIALPTYPFERRRHWIEPRPMSSAVAGTTDGRLGEPADVADVLEPAARSVATTYAPPRTAAERVLVDLWEKSLGVQPVGIHDDYFELGGTSLMAIQLLTNLPATLKGRVQLADLLGARTIATLAVRLGGSGAAQLPADTVLLRDGFGDPVFCPHALLGGAVSVYEPLIRHLPPGRPFYGFVAAGLDGVAEPRRSIEAMSEAYLASMRAIQPRGPYRLVGFSTGGLIAYDLARRLREGGDEVALLALLDARAAAEFPDGVRRGGYDAVLDEFLRPHIEQLMPDFQTTDAIDPMIRVARAIAAASFSYRPGPYDGAVSFIAGEDLDNPFVYPSEPPETFWQPLVPAFHITRVPGNHYSMLSEDRAANVARVLSPLVSL